MKFNPRIHQRQSIRLKGYDYAQAGLYFVTLNCADKLNLFGKIVWTKTFSPIGDTAELILNDAGKIAEKCWLAIPEHFPNVVLHEYVIMPNHVHGIIEITYNASVGDLIDPDVVRAKNFSPDNVHDLSTLTNPKNDRDIIQTKNDGDIIRAENDGDIIRAVNDRDVIRAENDGDIVRAKNFSPLRVTPSKTIGSIIRGFKIGGRNGCGKIPMCTTFGNAIITTSLSETKNHITTYRITSVIIHINGGKTNFIRKKFISNISSPTTPSPTSRIPPP